MARRRISTTILLMIVAQVNSQFFNYFGVQPVTQSPKHFNNDYSSIRTKVVRVPPETQISWKNTTYSFSYDRIEKEDDTPRGTSREKKRRQPLAIPTLKPIFNFQITEKPVKKTTKTNSSPTLTSHRENGKRKNPTRDTKHDIELAKHYQADLYDVPGNNVAEEYNRPPTAKPYNYNDFNNGLIYDTYDYTTKSPIYNRPGVKPVVVENGPPITNKPFTERPYRVETQNPFKPQNPYRPEQPPYEAETEKPAPKHTVKPYLVNPIPTQEGAVVFPHEDDPPEIIRGPDEDYMSEAEKRRHIEMAEKMCDQYKSLNTKQLAAIPLLPSPEPVSVNVSQCTPAQIPLVVGGKVVTINEFPHMALLGWVKIDGGGYSWKCGGSLISDQFVLTAAHCSYEERDNTVFSGPPRVVQFGSSYMDDPGALVVRVAAVIRHPKYKFPRSYYDIALLKLIQPVSFSEVIKPACLGVPPAVDRPIIATGWGRTEFGGDQSVELRSVSLPVWDMDSCREILGTSRKMPQGPQASSQVCAGEKRGGKDTCQGDSGGPAQLQEGCTWRVVAVTSLGRSCGAPNTPGLYATVQRAFIAAAVFGNIKNNQRRSDSSQNTDYNRPNQEHTTKSYKTNSRSTEAYYEQQGWQNGNRRTTTKSYYNQQQNGHHRPTTTESYYNPHQNGNHRTTTTESYYKPQQSNHRQTESHYNQHQNGKRRTSTTESYYNPQQNVKHRTTTTESYDHQPQHDYDRPSYDYRPVTYDTDYINHNQRNKPRNTQNRRPIDTSAYDQQNERSESQRYDNNRRDISRFEPGTVWFTK